MGKQLIRSNINDQNILVVYHYFEKDQTYVDNFCHFLRFGYDSELSYLVVVAGKCTIDLPALDNIQYFFSENKNFDYGGYSAAINSLSIWEKYNFYFFINSSVRGPFMPSYDNQRWADIFIDQFSADIGIVGSAISITPSDHSIFQMYHEKYGVLERNKHVLAHVQTTCYALSREVLGQLINLDFYGESRSLSKDEAVRDYEIRLSQIILDMGLNLRCMLPEYNQIDYRSMHEDINPSSREGDSGFERSYYGRSAHPYESIFIKTSRNIFSEDDLMRFAFSMSLCRRLSDYLSQQALLMAYIKKIQARSLRVFAKSKSHKKNLLKSLLQKI